MRQRIFNKRSSFCEWCGKEFLTGVKWKRYCSKEHKAKAEAESYKLGREMMKAIYQLGWRKINGVESNESGKSEN